MPELEIAAAHGRMRAEQLDELVLAFAEGRYDVLLTTAIIETGLDIPGADTMLVWHPEKFGMAQLHQLRGRVGRGRQRAACYLLHDPGEPLPPEAERRLRTLEAFEGLGAGFAISARDLDLRGAGDLMGEDQAGHLRRDRDRALPAPARARAAPGAGRAGRGGVAARAGRGMQAW